VAASGARDGGEAGEAVADDGASDLPKGAMGQLQLFEDAWHPLADEGDAVTTGRLRQRS